MELLSQHPVIAILGGLLLLLWLVLFLLLPFIAEGIRSWTMRNHRELRAISAKLDALQTLLAERQQTQSASEDAPPAKRREPIISDFSVEPDDESRRRRR